MKTAENTLLCNACGAPCPAHFFSLDKAFERVTFYEGEHCDPTITDVEAADDVALFCSRTCLELRRRKLLKQEGIELPKVAPEIESFETCACCNGPVNTREWHLAYSEMEAEDGIEEITVINAYLLAVVCRRCRPCDPTRFLSANRSERDQRQQRESDDQLWLAVKSHAGEVVESHWPFDEIAAAIERRKRT